MYIRSGMPFIFMRTSLNNPKLEKCSCDWLLSYFQDSYALAFTSKNRFWNSSIRSCGISTDLKDNCEPSNQIYSAFAGRQLSSLSLYVHFDSTHANFEYRKILHRIMLQFELSTALPNSRRMQAENDQTSQEAIVAPDITEKTKQGIASTAKWKRGNQR